MIQEHDSEGNPKCVYCGQVMRPQKRYRTEPLHQYWYEVGYANSGIFCSKSCGFTYGLIHAHFRLEEERVRQCVQDGSTISPQTVTLQPSSAAVLTQGPHGVITLQSGSVVIALSIESLDTCPGITAYRVKGLSY